MKQTKTIWAWSVFENKCVSLVFRSWVNECLSVLGSQMLILSSQLEEQTVRRTCHHQVSHY